MSHKEPIATPNAPKALGPYSAGMKTEQFIFTAGQLGLDPATNEFVPGGIQEQTRQALLNLKGILEAAGSSLSRVVKTTVFLRDMGEFAQMNEIYAQFFTENFPARSTIQVARLPKDGAVEIEAIALVN